MRYTTALVTFIGEYLWELVHCNRKGIGMRNVVMEEGLPAVVVRPVPCKPHRKEMRSQEEVLAYGNEDILHRMQKDLRIPRDKAESLFKDMLRFLYLCGAYPEQRPLYPPPMIDEAWHTFLLFTRDYHKFCVQNFGWFVHHAPVTNAMRQARLAAGVKPDITILLAESLFGQLSPNWNRKDEDGCVSEPQSCSPDHD